jgi:DNA anti-recombination protein RmuC
VSADDAVRRLRTTIEGARAMPMSSSVVVNRREVLDLLSQLEAALHDADARTTTERPDSGAHDASAQATQQTDSAAAERAGRQEESEVVREARELAARIRSEAEQESAELRTETDEYVDGQLAHLEISLTKTLETIKRGRERLHERSHFASLAPAEGPDE